MSPAFPLEVAAETFRCLTDLCGPADEAALDAIYDVRANCLSMLRDLQRGRNRDSRRKAVLISVDLLEAAFLATSHTPAVREAASHAIPDSVI